MEKKVRIEYLLSEAGRKKSLISGGDGKGKQAVDVDLTAEAVELASVDYSGNAVIDLTKPLCEEVIVSSYGTPHLYEKMTNFYFDAPQTGDQLIQFEKERRAKIAEQKEALQPELKKALEEYTAKEERRKVEEEARKKERDRRDAEARAERERLKEEKASWISHYGSDYLKRSVNLGYNCQRQYVTERASLEFPGYTVDFDYYANWEERSCPSEAALNEVEKLIRQGHKAKVVWLTEPPYETNHDDYYAEGPFESCEAIIIEDYLGKYVLVREL